MSYPATRLNAALEGRYKIERQLVPPRVAPERFPWIDEVVAWSFEQLTPVDTTVPIWCANGVPKPQH